MTKTTRFIAVLALLTSGSPALAVEEPVAPYTVADANAGTTPIKGDGVYKALHGTPGIARIVDTLIKLNRDDPRIADIFKAEDDERLRRTLIEDVCYVAGGPCHYTGRDMKTAHANMGLQTADFDAVVENLQTAMDREGVPFHAQNRLLAKLAPMRAMIVTR